MSGQYGVQDICTSLPTIVGTQGIETVLQLPLSAEEEAAFGHSATVLRERFKQIA